MSGWWVLHYANEGLVLVLACHVVWVIFSITLHELGHGYAAIWQGDDTPIRLHRMTMDPFTHITGMAWLTFALIGFTWGSMPVDPSKFRSRRQGRAYIALAGPAVNVALWIACVVLLSLWLRVGSREFGGDQFIVTLLFLGAELNLGLMFFNLLPIPPLDGSAALEGLSFRWYQLVRHPHAPMISLFIFLVVVMSGLTFLLTKGCYVFTESVVDSIGNILGSDPVGDVLIYEYRL